MNLSSAIENYVVLKRSLGAVFSVDARILRSFTRVIGDVGLEVLREVRRGSGLRCGLGGAARVTQLLQVPAAAR